MHNISIEEHQLIGDIYDAALDARLWPNILTKIATHTQAKTSGYKIPSLYKNAVRQN